MARLQPDRTTRELGRNISMAPIMKNAVQKTLRMGGFGRAVQRPRESLTQQFFLDGERQEAEGWKELPPPPDVVESDPEMHFDSFDRVPRRHRVLKVFLALGLSAALAGFLWTIGKPFLEGTGRQVASDMMRRLDTGRATAPKTKAEVAVGALAPAARVAVAKSSSPSQLRGSSDDRQAPADRSARALAPAVPESAKREPPLPPTRAAVAAGEALFRATRDARQGDADGIALAHRRAIRVMPVRPAGAGDGHPEALRGFVWSPSAKALLPVEPGASTTAPVPLEAAAPTAPEGGGDEAPTARGSSPTEPPPPAPVEVPGGNPRRAPILDP